MDVSHILDSLNDEQRNAVANPSQHLLVLAGAGSGKTRVLLGAEGGASEGALHAAERGELV